MNTRRTADASVQIVHHPTCGPFAALPRRKKAQCLRSFTGGAIPLDTLQLRYGGVMFRRQNIF